MRIWIITTEIPPRGCGGIGRYVDNFARALAAEGEEVTVFAYDPRGEDRVVDGLFRVVPFGPPPGWMAQHPDEPWTETHPFFPYTCLHYPLAAAWELSELLKKHAEAEGAPDVIESQEYIAIPYFVMQRQRVEPGYLENVPMVINLHTPDFLVRRLNEEVSWRIPDWWSGELEKACIVGADALIAPSQSLADRMGDDMGEPDMEVSAFPLPLPPLPELPEAPTDPHRVVFNGRIEPRKGVIETLRSCEQMWAGGEDFRLTLFGGSVYSQVREEDLDKDLRRRHSDSIEAGRLEFAGQVDFETLQQAVARAGVVLIPSRWENFPNACMEPMALGKVVVASVNGGPAEMIGDDGKAGFLFDWKKPGDFETKLKAALALTPEEREAMGAEAQRRIQKLCDPRTVARRRIKHFKQVIAQRRERTHFPFLDRNCRSGAVNARITRDPEEAAGLVSVVVPFYNLGKFVEGAIESVLASDYSDTEIVIVNDGSTDPASLEALDRLRERGLESLRILDIPNGGLSNARNVGAQAARGEYLLFLDADDEVTPTFISRAVHVFQRFENVHIVSAWARYFEGADAVFPSWNLEFPYLLLHNMMIPICAVRRSAFLAFGQNRREMTYGFEDWDAWISMVGEGCGGVAIPAPLVRYRVREGSMFQVIGRGKGLYLYQLIGQRHRKLYERYGEAVFNLQNANGPGLALDNPAPWTSPYEKLTREHYEATSQREEIEAQLKKAHGGLAWYNHQMKEKAQRIEAVEARHSELENDLLTAREEKVALQRKLALAQEKLEALEKAPRGVFERLRRKRSKKSADE